MNIEDSIKTLKEFNKIKINSYAMQFVNISYPDLQEAIETLLTAYEKEKGKNKRLEKFIENGEYTWKQKYNETFEYFKAELEKEKEKNKELEDTLRCTQNSWYEDTKVIIDKNKIIEELKKYKK